MRKTDGTPFWLFSANLKRWNLNGKILNSAALSKLKLLKFSFVQGNFAFDFVHTAAKVAWTRFCCSNMTWICFISDSVNNTSHTSQIQFRSLPTMVLNQMHTRFFLMQHGVNSQHLMQVWRLSGATYVKVLWKRKSSLQWFKKKKKTTAITLASGEITKT